MNQQNTRNLTPFDLLARSWQRPSAVTEARFSTDGSVAAFASEDGTIAIAAVADQEPPESRIRVSGDLGQTTIRPRAKPPVPLISTPQLAPEAVPLAACGQSDFLVGGGAGAVFLLRADGGLDETGLKLEGRVVAIDHSLATGATVASDGARILLVRPHRDTIGLAHDASSPITALALSRDASHLAFSAANRLSIWVIGDEIMPLDNFAFAGRPVSIRWNRQGPWLACALEDGGYGLIDLARARSDTVAGFPAPVRSVCWSLPANALVTSGAFRIAAWSMSTPPFADATAGALETGRASMVLVEMVAAHPEKQLVAAGYADGRISIAQLGARDELIVRPSGGTVTALTWSRDGRHLAVGAADGTAALVTFPAQMFK